MRYTFTIVGNTHDQDTHSRVPLIQCWKSQAPMIAFEPWKALRYQYTRHGLLFGRLQKSPL